MSKKTALILTILLLFLVLAIFYVFLETKHYNSKIFPGIYIADFYVGGLSKEQAETKLYAHIMKCLKEPVIILYNDKKWFFYPENHIRFDLKKSIDQAFSSGRKRFFLYNYIAITNYRNNPLRLPLYAEFINNASEDVLNKIQEYVFTKPKDAYFEIIGDSVNIVNETQGKEVDLENLKRSIIDTLCKKYKVVNIKTKPIQAAKTRNDLLAMNIKVKMAEFSTKFNKSLKERTQNIRLAANKLNGYIIAPGQIFSFNDAVGERTGEKGYKAAPIFFQNETVPGIGGGVCQLSSTIYNLALIAGMEIIERSNHSLPVTYVPLGRDATVNYNYIDLKFKNNTKSYILLYTEVNDDTLTVRFYGEKKVEENIKFYSEVIRKIPPLLTIKKDINLEKGKTRFKEGSPGYQVRVWKIYSINGKEEKKIISEDIYKPTPSILYVGEKEKNDENSIQGES
ncbi:MAG: VanW family protein [Tepidanaerobacteraceae bacterium]|jgi:vancomycin resistance protein YoaR|nr:VanW family protein [Tepidanaerobacteraceae bacterium]